MSKSSFVRRLVGLPWPPLLAVLLVLMLVVTFFVQQSVGTRQPPPPDALAILVSGDTQGLLLPCGCAAAQPGGLSRRASMIAHRTAAGKVIYADLGNAPGGNSPYDLVKFAAILRGELAMGVAAHNLGPAEVRLGADELHRLARELKVPFVSTNVRDREGRPLAESLRLVEIAGRRIAVAGLLSRQYADDAVQILDPAVALAEALNEQKPQYDSLLVLAYLPDDEVAALAARLPEKSLLVGPSSNQGLPAQAEHSSADGRSAAIAGAVGRDGRSLLRIEFASLSQDWTADQVLVAAALPDDLKQIDNLEAYHRELAGYDFPPEKTGLSMPLAPDVASTHRVAGTFACRTCHEGQCTTWDSSRHARAWSSLVNRGVHYDAACQRCHTTGYGWTGGFRSVDGGVGVASVGCESCHGPSMAHALDPSVRTPLVASAQCTVCHDADNSPGFEYSAAWPRIQHGSSPTDRGRAVGEAGGLDGARLRQGNVN